ncbi:MAG: hypothetical protein SF339_21400 [Blastocatellia bacterium]|nr:hypothetical protein [Blastocatellia bacterium]
MQSDRSTASRLLRAVIAKSFIEILLVCLVATLVAFSTFNPQLRGAVDVAGPERLAGWVNDPRAPDERIEVQLFIDGRFVATTRADGRRDDLVAAGVTATPSHGFEFDLVALRLPPGRHPAQVFALRPTTGGRMMLLPITKQPSLIQVEQ